MRAPAQNLGGDGFEGVVFQYQNLCKKYDCDGVAENRLSSEASWWQREDDKKEGGKKKGGKTEGCKKEEGRRKMAKRKVAKRKVAERMVAKRKVAKRKVAEWKRRVPYLEILELAE